jgi:leucyl aminopeptidase
MKITLHNDAKSHTSSEFIILAAYSNSKEGKKAQTSKAAMLSTDRKEIIAAYEQVPARNYFKGERGENFLFTGSQGVQILAVGLGDKRKTTLEHIRRAIADAYKQAAQRFSNVSIDLDSFDTKQLAETTAAIVEAIGMTSYVFDKHLSSKKTPKLQTIYLDTLEKKSHTKKIEEVIKQSLIVTDSIALARDFVNEPPNVLNSEVYAKLIEADSKKLPGVKIKVLNKAQMKKEKMDLFLSVNDGSAFEARLVHLTYTPKKASSKTKHIAFVGKGLTFDTGGYSLKPADSMVNMKFDMAGSSTVYGAFRALALLEVPVKLTCVLGLTDNSINSLATKPDSIVRARNGKTVEILNTDAEGRLVLADCLDYTSELKPDAMIDAATLTGACLVALGHETCGLMANNDKLANELLDAASQANERMWRLPIFEEFSNDIKSPIADLKNMGSNRFGGSSKAAAFLQEFVRDGISWAHLDIAGIGDGQGHLPYCPAKGASGLVIRSLIQYVQSQKA